jgi:3-oxoacyl-[acyl-carrier protein] reductase
VYFLYLYLHPLSFYRKRWRKIMLLTNKVAIVTGAGRGLGAAVARALAQAGARVVINDLNPDRAAKVAAEISAAGGQAVPIQADVSNKFHCVKLVEETRAIWGQIDILVNYAAVAPTATILKMDEWEFQRCLEVNVKGIFFMSQLCGRVMADENKERGAG